LDAFWYIDYANGAVVTDSDHIIFVSVFLLDSYEADLLIDYDFHRPKLDLLAGLEIEVPRLDRFRNSLFELKIHEICLLDEAQILQIDHFVRIFQNFKVPVCVSKNFQGFFKKF
jgi:hypothetical protein